MGEAEMDRILEEILKTAFPNLYAVVVDLLRMGQTREQILARVDAQAPGSIIGGVVEGAIRHMERGLGDERHSGQGAGGEAGSPNGRH